MVKICQVLLIQVIHVRRHWWSGDFICSWLMAQTKKYTQRWTKCVTIPTIDQTDKKFIWNISIYSWRIQNRVPSALRLPKPSTAWLSVLLLVSIELSLFLCTNSIDNIDLRLVCHFLMNKNVYLNKFVSFFFIQIRLSLLLSQKCNAFWLDTKGITCEYAKNDSNRKINLFLEMNESHIFASFENRQCQKRIEFDSHANGQK